MKAAFYTLGCRVNQYETEAMAEKFIKDGWNIVNFDEIADVYVINTCTVTNIGDKKSRQMIHRAKRLNDKAIIVVAGCYAQIAPEEIAGIDGVDIVLGTRNKGDIVYYVNRYMSEHKQLIEVNDVMKNKKFEELDIEEYQDKTRAFVKIQDGCNRFCSYCLIPYARGAVCSKSPSKIYDEVKKLSENGFREIILSGINTASYGCDLDENTGLIDILENINEIPGIERIRIGSLDPEFFTDEVIAKAAKLSKLCPHFHLSLQSGCDVTLKRMNRHYTTAEYEKIVSSLRANIPDVSITTDIIVGFPGETEEEFDITYDYLKRIKLSKMHIFKYSPRKGTRAAGFKDQVDAVKKEERSTKLIDLDKELEQQFRNRFTGRTMDVLYEQKLHDKENTFEGYTPNYIKVQAEASQNIEGRIIPTLLEKSIDDSISGKIFLKKGN